MHNVGTVPTYKMHNVGTVPTYKMHNIGTVPMFKIHNIGTPNLFFLLEFGLYGNVLYLRLRHRRGRGVGKWALEGLNENQRQ